MTVLTPASGLQAVRLASDLPLAALASIAAFAFDARGGPTAFLATTFVFLAITPWSGWLSVRALEKGNGVEPFPADAVTRARTDVWRRERFRVPLMVALTALVLLVLGTVGAGISLGSNLGALVSLAAIRAWEDGRDVDVFVSDRAPWLAWWPRKSEPFAFTRPRAALKRSHIDEARQRAR